MPRPMWSGSISFGLVNIPVKLYNAVKKKSIHFNQLRKSDGCRIRLKKICPSDGAEVPADNIVKGYEISPEQYVIVTSEELEAIQPQNARTIAIEDFVKLEQIDPLYYNSCYYLTPDKGAGKAYFLLLAAMQNTGKVAIARVVMRNKEYLTAIRPTGKALALSTMHFADEVIAAAELEELPTEVAEPNKKELAMAEQLIESLATGFEPGKYHDQYYQQVMDMLEKKAEGQTIISQPEVKEGGKVIDLMAALEASISAIKGKSDSSKAKKQGITEKAPAPAKRKKASAQ
ncbi:putative DNA repair protein YkoV [Sporomusa ovata DSM 2662]|uniref:Non-homologous end joining protein Ku n=1 Tax=Sporomusa ovata TaxID=2378 RepID=A0A0U1KRP0_9FIRM|nr:Ku protein [Sporomusa ovata]EQB24875.1 putative DNA repair protein [Sporomusa ovata DSM 2662]CQR70072.1 Ku domain protein [Sporomusa ovata]